MSHLPPSPHDDEPELPEPLPLWFVALGYCVLLAAGSVVLVALVSWLFR
jgi:hypothetical protein